jgi:uncharacterized protein Yka (UPF0111/DUF47 family)
MLVEQATSVLEGLKLADEYCDHPSIERAEIVDRAEKRSDVVHRALMSNLRRAIVTVFDRHNIENLSQRLDDILDEAKKAVLRMVKFNVMPDKHIKEMLNMLIEAVEFLIKAIEDLTGDTEHCQMSIDSARKRENKVQHIFEEWYTETRPKPEEFASADTIKLRNILETMIKCRDEEKVMIAFMKSADWVVMAANEIETIRAKIS